MFLVLISRITVSIINTSLRNSSRKIPSTNIDYFWALQPARNPKNQVVVRDPCRKLASEKSQTVLSRFGESLLTYIFPIIYKVNRYWGEKLTTVTDEYL